ncbi:MAG: 50S ribosomal protein L37e [Candidatus Aenigmarchaeota archaeon]|nr:50S ribosomal protein L37e [Candidatus Aenigmarchaeota archaeon]
MSKGTPSFGKHHTITHIRCQRCGRHSYHIKKQQCSACGYPRPKIRDEGWRWKKWNKSVRKTKKVLHMKPKTARMGKRIK